MIANAPQVWNKGEYRIARKKMVEMQIKKRGIKDPRVLTAMAETPRHFFVDEAQAAQAYLDTPLPIGYGQTISQPFIVALMLEALNLAPTDRVLEVGFGSGYQTALLASLAAEVWAVERIEGIFNKGRANLARLGQTNVQLKLADGTLGWPQEIAYDAIIVAAGGPRLPQPLIDQLALGGRLIVPVGPSDDYQKLTLVTKEADGSLLRETVGEYCRFVNLVGRHAWAEGSGGS